MAELMLQRTKADQVASIYEKFISTFPNLQSLARADIEQLSKLLEPLGLLHRIPRFKRMAEFIVERYGGSVPSRLAELLKIPGVGRYIAHAVLCFGYGEDVPVVDANVVRVYSRIFGLKLKARPHTDKKLWELATRLVPPGKAREFNEAILDFAALVCKPRKPECSRCPVVEICQYNRRKNE